MRITKKRKGNKMLLDLETLFSDAQAITTSAASTNIVKMANTEHNMPEVAFGTPMPLIIQVVEDFAGATSVAASIQTSAAEDFSSPKTLVSSGDIPIADLKTGYKFPINYIPKGNLGYMRVYYDVKGASGAGTATGGKITAGMVAAHDNSYQDM